MSTLLRLLNVLLLCCCAVPAWAALSADELGLVINMADPVSVEVGEYYQARRGIPSANVVRLNFPAERSAIGKDELERLRAEVDAALPEQVRALALAWTRPYRAGCMGITSAFAFGFDEAFCSATCGPTRASALFNNGKDAPEHAARGRPAMLLAGESVAQVKALIDRGVAADYTYPRGTAYLVRTQDAARNVRARYFDDIRDKLGAVLGMASPEALEAQALTDVLAYFTGAARLSLDKLKFLPGAPADHLTSFGGQLTDSSQTSVLAWLSAGATASYGTVTEPCNHLQKFPHPGVLLAFYIQGDSLIEAYWKSVAWPGEGVFVGEPLARPFGARVQRQGTLWTLQAYSGVAGGVMLETAPSIVGPYRQLGVVKIRPGYNHLPLPGVNAPVLRIAPMRRAWVP